MRKTLTISLILNLLTITLVMVMLSIVLKMVRTDNPTALAVDNLAEAVQNINREIEDEKNHIPAFSMTTEAVCEELSGATFCHDELFANCGKLKYRIPKISGDSKFERDWNDPREINMS